MWLFLEAHLWHDDDDDDVDDVADDNGDDEVQLRVATPTSPERQNKKMSPYVVASSVACIPVSHSTWGTVGTLKEPYY